MLSFPHLVVLFVVALVIFGPQKLPELARMLGKATAEFRKMTNDFRYALEDEVRELERNTRIREEETAAAARATPPDPTPPEGSMHRSTVVPEASTDSVNLPAGEPAAELSTHADAAPAPTTQEQQEQSVTAQGEKPSDDHTAI